MSGEAESKIEGTFIDKLGAKYPFVQVKAAAKQAYAIRAFPSYRVIAPDGSVHSHSKPSDATIEKLLANVTLAPKLPDESRYGPLRKMWEKKQHKKLETYLAKMLGQDKLDADMRSVFEGQKAALETRASKRLAKVEKLGLGPDYLKSKDKLTAIQKEWAGFPAADAAKEQLARFSKDAAIKKEISACKALRKLEAKYDPSKQSQARKIPAAMRKFAKKYAGTWAGEQAEKIASR